MITKQDKKVRHLPNRFVYAAFLLTTLIFIFVNDFPTAILFAGIGLVFDPFDESVSFQRRPLWQRIWLVAHCVLVLVILMLSWFTKVNDVP